MSQEEGDYSVLEYTPLPANVQKETRPLCSVKWVVVPIQRETLWWSKYVIKTRFCKEKQCFSWVLERGILTQEPGWLLSERATNKVVTIIIIIQIRQHNSDLGNSNAGKWRAFLFLQRVFVDVDLISRLVSTELRGTAVEIWNPGVPALWVNSLSVGSFVHAICLLFPMIFISKTFLSCKFPNSVDTNDL